MANQRLLLAVLGFLLLVYSNAALKSVTPKQLELLVPKSEFLVVVFQSSLTEHHKELSKRVVEEVDRVSTALSQDPNTRVRFYSVSLDQHPESMTDYGLNDIPSIVIFRDKYPRVYYGQRTAYTLFSFFQELMTADPVKLINNKQDKKQFTADEHSVKVVVYISKEGESLEAFKSAARHYQGEITFGLVQDPKIAKLFKLKSEGDAAILKPGERPIHLESGFTTREELVDWIQQNRKALWGILTFQNIYSVWQGIKTTLVAFVKNMDDFHSKTVLSTFKTLAKQYGPTNDISFVIVDTGIYKEFAQGVGLSDDDLPTFTIFHPVKRKEHFFPKDKQQLNIKNAKRWVESFIAGKLESDDMSFYSEDDAVVKVDSKNFDEVVLDQDKDVLLEFYGGWCSHCAALAPHYKLVASYLKLFPSIVLGAFDVESGEIPGGHNISSLPTLLFFPANDKANPILFDGFSRDRKGIVQFLLQHQTKLDDDSKEKITQLFASFGDEVDDGESSSETLLTNDIELEQEL